MPRPTTDLRLQHIAFETSDGVRLVGMQYYSEQKNDAVAVYLHGAGSSSILNNPELNVTLAKALAGVNVDLLLFDNRGAGYIKKLHRNASSDTSTTVELGGMGYEVIADAVYDIDGALEWAKTNGYTKVYLIGHSTGANKLCYYLGLNHVNSMIEKAFLLAGGDDITLQRQRLAVSGIDRSVVTDILNTADDTALVPADLFPGEHPISTRSLRELITPGSDYDMFPFGRYQQQPDDPHFFEKYTSIQVPQVVVYGSLDFGTVMKPQAAVSLLMSLNNRAAGRIIEGADHNFTGYEESLAKIIAKEIQTYGKS